MRRVAIVGCGLIGGSIGLGLRKWAPDVRILAVDFDRVLSDSMMAALAAERCPLDAPGFEPSQLGADLVVLSLPISQILSALPTWLGLGIPVTDTGSTKVLIADQGRTMAGGEWLVPGHPMAGKAQGGFASASPDLFVERPWILCPAGSRPDATRTVGDLLQILRARRVDLEVGDHDRAVAVTSHVPHVLASWLWNVATSRRAHCAAGPSFADMTRTAGPPEALWRDILATNAGSIAEALRDCSESLAKVAEGLEQDPPRLEAALHLFQRARESRPTGSG